MPKWFEYVFNTPSHHRVHHSSDINYLDMNHAGVLIVWDRMFGTFIEEKDRPNYGIRENLTSYNPLVITIPRMGSYCQRPADKYFSAEED